jgi:hypothetical protein
MSLLIFFKEKHERVGKKLRKKKQKRDGTFQRTA